MLAFIRILIFLSLLAFCGLGIAIAIAQTKLRLKVNKKIIDEVKSWEEFYVNKRK